jgi:hypothetical protein
MSGINAVVTNLLKMLFRYMLSQASNEIKGRKCFDNWFFVFMTVVMEGNEIAVVRINPSSSNDWSAKITANVFYNSGRITFVWHSADIEAIFMI